jgi:hypothetical protein
LLLLCVTSSAGSITELLLSAEDHEDIKLAELPPRQMDNNKNISSQVVKSPALHASAAAGGVADMCMSEEGCAAAALPGSIVYTSHTTTRYNCQ